MDSTDLWFTLHDDLIGDLRGADADISVDFINREVNVGNIAACDPRTFAAVSLLRSIVKKFQDEIDQDAADKAAFDAFHEANAACEGWVGDESALGPYDEVIVGEFRHQLWDFFTVSGYGLLSEASILPDVDFGPGSSPGADDTSFLTKLGHSTLTAASQLPITLFDGWVRDNPHRVDAEISRTYSMGNPVVVQAVKITPVPKTAKISRLVKPEPSLNMMFQKGIAAVLRRRLRTHFGINLEDQPDVNRRLAQQGSRDGMYGTLDLKAASDYISVRMLKKFLPRDAFNWLYGLRSAMAETPDGVVQLHMMCTMGNDFCFPLQTILFACAVRAVYRSLGLPIRDRKVVTSLREAPDGKLTLYREQVDPNWTVFGDDIIVRREAFEPLCRLLRYLGGRPNTDKSFNKGPFRESCGADYLNGVNVRGVYCTTLRTMQDRYSLINSLTDWSARTGIRLPRTMALLLSSVARVEVPPWEQPDSGIRMPLICVSTSDVFRCHKHSDNGRPDYWGSYLYKRYVPRNEGRDVGYYGDEPEHPEARRFPQTYWNASAVFLAALKGSLKGGRCVCRLYETPYRKRLGVAPCWDYAVPGTVTSQYWRQWFAVATGYFSRS